MSKIADTINFTKSEIIALKKGEILIEELSKTNLTVRIEKLAPEKEMEMMGDNLEERVIQFAPIGGKN